MAVDPKKIIIIPSEDLKDDILKQDVGKIHSEINQLNNQRYTITTAAISFLLL
ncbi:MAG: hypothetical protein ABI480_12140 [Chitinophagaceae bacterium]